MRAFATAVHYPPEIARHVAERSRIECRERNITPRGVMSAVRTADGGVKLDRSTTAVAGGALDGRMTNNGIADDFIRELSTRLDPAEAAIFVLADHLTIDKVAPVLSGDPGSRLHSSSGEANAELSRAVTAETPAPDATGVGG